MAVGNAFAIPKKAEKFIMSFSAFYYKKIISQFYRHSKNLIVFFKGLQGIPAVCLWLSKGDACGYDVFLKIKILFSAGIKIRLNGQANELIAMSVNVDRAMD